MDNEVEPYADVNPTDFDDIVAVRQLASMNPDRGVFGGGLGFTGRSLSSRTTDGGETWTSPRRLYNPGGVLDVQRRRVHVDHAASPGARLAGFFNRLRLRGIART